MVYMMRKRTYGILGLALLLAFTFGCSTIVSAATFDELQEEINEERHQEFSKPLKHTADDYEILSQKDEADYTPEEVEKYSKWVHFQNKITKEEALEDIDQLMRLLKTSYAGYQYFGGDEKFDQVKDKMIKRVNETYKEGADLTYPFYLIIKEELAFIEDSRFRVGRYDSYFLKKSYFFDTDQRDFQEDEKGYYTVIDDAKWYLPIEKEQLLHRTINDQGELVYGLFTLAADGETLPKMVALQSEEGKVYNLDLSWTVTEVGPRNNNLKIPHEYYKKDGVPVTTLRRMSIDEHDIAMTNDFINEAKTLKDEDLFILDLRNNRGGVDLIADFFLYNLTGTRCDGKMQMVKRYSLMNKRLEDLIKNDEDVNDFSQLDFYKDHRKLVEDWKNEKYYGDQAKDGETVITDSKAKWYDKGNTVIVLINHETGASAEYFVSKLATMKNVIIVGTNSNGSLITDNVIDVADVYLQNAGIPINYGQGLLLHDQMDGFDLRGFTPDIITRGDALEAVLSMLKN